MSNNKVNDCQTIISVNGQQIGSVKEWKPVEPLKVDFEKFKEENPNLIETIEILERSYKFLINSGHVVIANNLIEALEHIDKSKKIDLNYFKNKLDFIIQQKEANML